MVELSTGAFADFLGEVTRPEAGDGQSEAGEGYEPFVWQANLVEGLLRGQIPDVIDVPTGLGKTFVVHAWTYALAASTNHGIRIPRRLFFVVDRRLVVDGTYTEATRLRRALLEPPGPVSQEVADRLAVLHGDSSLPPLDAVRMRGGVTWESRWLVRADQAAVVVGTVDQFGSRLLFRGYGTSPGMRPIDAALVGTDAWLVIDEAHIAGPLVETVSSARRLQDENGPGAEQALGDAPPLAVTTMSATAAHDDGAVLRADLDREVSEEANPRAREHVHLRVSAQKPVTLVDITNLASASAKTWRRSATRLGRALAGIAMETAPQAGVVAGVIANTIATARAAHERLVGEEEHAVLLIGRCRGFERDVLLETGEFARSRVGAERARDRRRLFVVATQTIEVGANLDFDLVVSEAAPVSSLIQRFGRVNRLGERKMRRSAIVHAGFAHGEDDPIYGGATADSWQHLVAGTGADPVDTTWKLTGFDVPEDPHMGLGLESARELATAAPAGTRLPDPFVPTLLGAHVERWAATQPAPHPDQEVGPFLHGVEYHLPTVNVAWRAVPENLAASLRSEVVGEGDPVVAGWRSWLDLIRPTSWEFVEVPIWELRGLVGDTRASTPTADLEIGHSTEVPESDEVPADGVVGVVYRGLEEDPVPIRVPADIRPGDRVVLDARIGGHDEWGWTGERRREEEPPVPDVAELIPTRRKAMVRLSPTLLEALMAPGGATELQALLEEARNAPEDEHAWDVVRPQIADLLRSRARQTPGGGQTTERRAWALDAVADMLSSSNVEKRPTDLVDRDLPVEVLMMARRRTRGAEGVEDRRHTDIDQVSDDDPLSTSMSEESVGLHEHGDHVAALAEEVATNLGLVAPVRDAISLAARWHDLGKAETRFQTWLFDGDDLAARSAERPRAKSGRDPGDPVAKRAFHLSGLPTGFRHEAVSGRLVDELIAAAPAPMQGLDTELVRHLVVAHHGHARPLLPPRLDPDARPVRVLVDDLEVKIDGDDQGDWRQPARFEALNERYGWWGLALAETIVRLADMRCSEMGR